MMRCEVLIPFHLKATNTNHVPGDIIVVSDAQLAKIRAVSVNMVSVLGEVEEKEETKPKRKPKAK